jgi:hypothetical protein
MTANDDQLTGVHHSIVAAGEAMGTRVLSLQPAGGLHTRILLDRGMDLGSTWYRGEPVSWLSAVGEQSAGHADDAEGWHRGWAGGLVTTCGLRNVGKPSEGHGRNGTYSDRSARNVRVEQTASGIRVTGEIHDHDGLGRGLVLFRTLEFDIGQAAVEITDTVVNESVRDEQAPILYHVNFGYPFLTPTTRTTGSIQRSWVSGQPEEELPFASEMGEPADVADEVAEHAFTHSDGVAALTIESPPLGMRARISWGVGELPRLHTWRRRRPGSYVHSIEPANCGIRGRLADRRDGSAPILRAGHSRTTRIGLQFTDAM